MEMLNKEDLKSAILKLKTEKNAVILAHYYQEKDIQDVADYIGDSLGLAIEASKTDAERSEEHTSELQSRPHLVCRLLLEKKKKHKDYKKYMTEQLREHVLR